MSTNGAAILGSALNSAAPALSLTVLGGQGGDDLVVDGDGLGVVLGSIIELV